MARPEIIRSRRTFSLFIQSTVLGVGLVSMLVVFIVIQSRIPEAIGMKRLGLLRVAWVVSALAWSTAILFVWSLMRYYRFVDSRDKPVKKRVYVDAWAEAGRRFQVDEKFYDEDDDDEDGDKGESDSAADDRPD